MIHFLQIKAGAFVSLLFFFLTAAIAQNNFNCTADELFKKQVQNDPEFARKQDQLEKETRQLLSDRATHRASQVTRIIPVVFHIIHAGGPENITMAQIQDQMRILNEDFPRLMADTVLTPAPFKQVAGAFDVEFRLATLDPNGNCTQGVTRTFSSLTTCSLNNDEVKSLAYWPSNQYLNIWLVASMHYGGNLSCVGGGYAQFPGGSAFTDGVNIRADLISSIGTSASNTGWGNFRGRYLVHELGHWFNLRHIWGDMNCGNDFVSDTPSAQTSNSGCPAFPYNAMNSCGAGADGEMFDNYMDYCQGACLNIFTQGQVTRMDAALSSSVSGRSNLWSSPNLIATGTSNPPGILPDCAPVPDMLPYTYKTICPGVPVTLTDVSYGGTATTRNWNCPGGLMAGNASDSVLSVTYNTPGVYTIDLTVGNANGTATTSFNSRVYVLDNVASTNYTTPLTESFENTSLFSSDWLVINPEGDNGWELSSASSYTGSNCITMQNYGSSAPLEDEIISPSYDISNLSGVSVKFKMHFSRLDSTNTDALRVYISKDCGQTWLQRYYKASPSALITTSAEYGSWYAPAIASAEWRQESFTVQSFNVSSNFRIKVRFTSGGGNNIYMDDINITGTPLTGINSVIDPEEGVTVFPNPSSANFNVKLVLLKNTSIQLSLVDMYGKLVKQIEPGLLNEGEHEVKLNATGLAPGIYVLKVFSGNLNLSTKKILVDN
ncbi:MAG: M43 family zinc metalloprotease [Bacteroidia bacterium]